MSRSAWAFLGWFAGSTTDTPVPSDRVLRVPGIELVDARGVVVGRFVAQADGVELVLGGTAQASLVSRDGVAALNLLGETTVLRAVASDAATVWWQSETSRAAFSVGSEGIVDEREGLERATHHVVD